jgi:hypothetical protein
MSGSVRGGVSRRNVLTAAGVGALGAFTLTAKAAADPQATTVGPLHVRRQLMLVDRKGQQRFLWQSTKPPVILNGTVYPPEARSGPDDSSYFIFNDENQNERGGIIVDSGTAQLSFDYPTVDALHLNAVNQDKAGASQLIMRQMPDPAIPIDQLKPSDAPPRVLLATDNVGDGALLFLYDSKGQPRIVLQVDGEDVPRIQILDGDGNVVAQMPPEAPTASPATRKLSPLLAAPRRQP